MTDSETPALAVDPAADPAQTFPAKRAAEIVGISYRQLDYWARTDLVKPSIKAQGSGSRRQYSYTDLLELRAIKNLLDSGLKLQSVRDVLGYIRDDLQQDVTTMNLVISGNESVVTRSGEELVDVLRGGQGVLNILPLGGVKDDVDAAIVELFPAEASVEEVATDDAATGS